MFSPQTRHMLTLLSDGLWLWKWLKNGGIAHTYIDSTRMENMCMPEYTTYAKEEHFLDAVTGRNTSSIKLKKKKKKKV